MTGPGDLRSAAGRVAQLVEGHQLGEAIRCWLRAAADVGERLGQVDPYAAHVARTVLGSAQPGCSVENSPLE
ncbi:hypothetical protein ACTOB_001262 [Actinoplanes oblitus]|uniref:ANTAR domain-containing protein n=1 Tax=Actinoplanes oblitus TaxID=3040509 RepID=A0ABY8WIM2_9ACTN|nr:hypothetical protein [Actinoplanes oblitus]WIM97714.1 hypothetical protein ACTOB_001262 [Actinoplanes oblitus]